MLHCFNFANFSKGPQARLGAFFRDKAMERQAITYGAESFRFEVRLCTRLLR
jgi:hypothetical protein